MNLQLALMTAVVSVIAVSMAIFQLASWLEAVSFVTGAICVWLTVKQNVWNFPIGLINVVTFGIVFFQSRLFADAGLQAVYFVLGAAGWWMWLYGGERRTRLLVSHAPKAEIAVLSVAGIVGTIALWRLLSNVGGAAPVCDALTTAISLLSQWLLNRKRLENWYGWIIVDVLYVPLYAYKHLYLTAALYAIFLLMAITGLRAWRESWQAEEVAVQPEGLGEAAS